MKNLVKHFANPGIAGSVFRALVVLTLGIPLAAAQDRPAPVTIAIAEVGPLFQEVSLTGTAMARRVSKLSPKVDGLVAEMLVDEGDPVALGEVLVRLDQELAEIELASAYAALEEAEARLKEAMRQRDEAAELVAKKHIPQTTYEGTIAQVEINEAAAKRLRAEHGRQKEIVERHVIRAPFDGTVGDKLVEVGEWVQTGTPVIELVEIDNLRVDVPVPQHYFRQVNVGTPAIVRFDALPDQTFETQVTMKVPVSNPAARTFPVRIEMDNRAGLKAPGMSARVTFLLREDGEADALKVPRDAVVRRPDGSQTVWLVTDKDGIPSAIPVAVETGRTAGTSIEILGDALNPSDKIVVRGNENLQPGQPVRIIRDDTSGEG